MLAPGLTYAGVALAALFVAIAGWEHARPARPPAAATGRRWFANLALYALCEIANTALVPILVAVAATLLPSAPKAELSAGALAVAAHFVMVVLALDLTYYLLHRLVHTVPALWRLHAIHHSDLDLDVTTTVRHHPAEVLVLAGGVVCVGALVGASAAEIAAYGVLMFGVQLLAHANIELPRWIARPLGLVVVTPVFHRLHHSRDAREYNANYGQVLVVWDRLFRTASPLRAAPEAFGVGDYLAPRYHTLRGMLLQPVERMKRMDAAE